MAEADELRLDELGVIPGLEETAAEQQQRYRELCRLNGQIGELFIKGQPFIIDTLCFKRDERIPPEVMAASMGPASTPYRFSLDWVPGFYSNRGLGLFFGGMALGFSGEDEESGAPLQVYIFQLREAFRKAKKFLIYSREELVSHEACHIARMALKAERYEEMLAYRISESAFRRYAGPIFASTRQVPLFIMTLMLFLGSQVVGILSGPTPLLWLGRAPFILLLVYWLLKNHRRHRTFKAAIANLTLLFSDQTEAAAFRLGDDDIDALGVGPMTEEQVRTTLFSTMSPLRQEMFERLLCRR